MTHEEKIEAGKKLVAKAAAIDPRVKSRLLDYDCELIAHIDDAHLVVVSSYGHTLLDISPEHLIQTIDHIRDEHKPC